MKKQHYWLWVLLVGLISFNAQAQEFPALDKSPHDISYYPQRGGEKVMRVLYGRPPKDGRTIFGDLVPFGKVWRLGANEATEISFFQNVRMGGKNVAAGVYSLFVIPNEGEWTVILNKNLHQWGAYNYDQAADVLRIQATVKPLKKVVDSLSMVFVKSEKGANLVVAWDKTSIEIPIEF